MNGSDDAQTLARFMAYVNGNIAREAGRLHDWHREAGDKRPAAAERQSKEGSRGQ